jgi:hypothetical protein
MSQIKSNPELAPLRPALLGVHNPNGEREMSTPQLNVFVAGTLLGGMLSVFSVLLGLAW